MLLEPEATVVPPAWDVVEEHNRQFTPELSIVVPTRSEAGNIEPLVTRLRQALAGRTFEIIFVDDSDDDTPAAILAIQQDASSRIQLIHRLREQRHGGLGGAVVVGMRASRAPRICVMDADLQHPPEVVPDLLREAQRTSADLVLASRYCAQGQASGLNRRRSFISHASTTAARVAFPRVLRRVSDPMSGFFLVNKAAITLDELHPLGFKILLEIVARHPKLRIAEVGFRFAERHAGASKASLREGGKYLAHLAHLRFNDDTRRFAQFLIVGLSGLVVNMLLFAIAIRMLGHHYLVAAALSTQVSTLWNFILSDYWVFRSRRAKEGRFWRLALFAAMNNAALLLRSPILYILITGLGASALLANFISLASLTLLRYGLADSIIWGRTRAKDRQATSYGYNIHGIMTVVSEVRLPELERFLTQERIEAPMLQVRIGNVAAMPHTAAATGEEVRHIRYDEGLGAMGFAVDITLGTPIQVVASPVLRLSPHVLYTNVVEPILRWTFVQHGYALVHGACLAFGRQAYLLTARTDTGKTTTMLRILAHQRRASDTGAFLSDDLTLVSSDGLVLTYPKPLTISAHTVRAVNSALLSWRERATLPFQSRIHSRSGRRFAFLLTQTRLPVATINTLVQLLVPPPKYHVQRLVPTTKLAKDAKLAGMFVIERGGKGEVHVDAEEALDILMRNCEDAYGFPPYETLKDVLQTANGKDLRTVERAIVGQALANHPTVVLRSTTMDWSFRIPAFVAGGARSEAPNERSAPSGDILPGLNVA